jgi:hypothetical protein
MKRENFRFSTFLPLDPSRTYESKLQLVQFNSELFLANFCLDKDDDLLVIYYMSFVRIKSCAIHESHHALYRIVRTHRRKPLTRIT